MSNITLSSNVANISVTSTPSNISVTDNDTNVTISNIVTSTTNVNVSQTQSNITVSATSKADVTDVREALSATTVAGSLGALTYSNATGIFNLNGPFDSDVRAAVSASSPVDYDVSTGIFSLQANASFLGKTTDDLPEGSTNLYYTTAKANSAIAAYQGDITTPGTIDANVLTGNNLSNIGLITATDIEATNVTAILGNVSDLIVHTGLNPTITFSSTLGGAKTANMVLGSSSNIININGSLGIVDANDHIATGNVFYTSTMRVGVANTALNAFTDGNGSFTGTGNIEIRGENRSILGNDDANTNNFVRVFGGVDGNADIVNNVAAAFNVLTADSSGTLDFILKANNNQIANY